MAFKRSSLMLLVSLAAIYAIAQDAADDIGSWAIRITSTDGWGLNETFWVNAEGETGYADLSARDLELPCSGNADAAVIDRIEANLIELVSEGLSEEPRTDEPRLRCEDGPNYHVLIRFGQEGEFEFLERRLNGLSTCRQTQISDAEEKLLGDALASGRKLREVCTNPGGQ